MNNLPNTSIIDLFGLASGVELFYEAYPSITMQVVKTFISDCYSYLKTALTTTSKKICPSVDVIFTQFGFYVTVYLFLCYVMYVVSTYFRNQLSRCEYFDKYAKRVMVITAHPDDECMFFGPLIVRLVKSNRCQVFVLCLSCGNASNSKLRKRELWDSCHVLGIPSERVILCCSSLRMDGHQYKWKSEDLAHLIRDHIETFDIDTVITFDKLGVSGHENHISLFRAVSFLSLRKWLPAGCRVFILDSLGLVRKYSSVMDCALTLITSQYVFILSPYEHEIVKKALAKHKTQINWYRKLYMYFSRYSYVNSFYEMRRFHEYTPTCTN
ncbi:N-acetylglucosaminyl-phosphatidylinositol de-N-acetylase-like [Homalodisca vitripennis]|uniref:N-acetylglucosaminyl-phosphatidylinositol de-N-acetylase-like n=1 Tax=Homalodisca vitripennis TaxID=197043 RepID=UPI001EECA534|nr:N-acetylglucosaminyl-phosphatidylinositol de-N-acetylase-like [Homalodisca vitripennis]